MGKNSCKTPFPHYFSLRRTFRSPFVIKKGNFLCRNMILWIVARSLAWKLKRKK